MTRAVLRGFSVRLLRVIGCAAILPLGIQCVSSARAADTCTGYDAHFVESADTTDLGHGMKQTTVKQHSILFSNDSIYNMLMGECSATVLQAPDGKTQMQGFCARHDKDGETQSIAIRLPPGADKIEWKSTGGTGKYAGKQDSGWAQNALTDGKM
ncbi:MAG: hypothetical protein JOY66_20835, partial [Acetobacteraceae bacterium]|nr:hypothetical protein [Acetobacteraceae bacterium]